MPSLIIHITSNAILSFFIYYYEKCKKKDPRWQRIALFVFSSHLIDLDHLLAHPIYDPLRCSINNHPLHSWYMFPVYFIGSIYGKYKYFFWAIVMHLVLDWLDCLI